MPATGLTAQEAEARLRAVGPNVLPSPRRTPLLVRLAAQFAHFFALMLWAAAGLAFLGGLPELGVAIIGVVVLNGLFAFVQEHRAERTADRLAELVPRRATVIRDGQPRVVEAEVLVPGDLVQLGPGDRVAADMQVVESHAMHVDSSLLTGESEPVLVERDEAALTGTFVTDGEGLATVTVTGADTRLAGIATLSTANRRPTTPLAQELRLVVRRIAMIAVSIGATYFVVALLLGTDIHTTGLFAIGVTVALVPEGLLPTVTLSLATAAQRLTRSNVLVRHLESVETLGSTTFICTDKTGTLTCNVMEVVEVWTPRSGSATITGDGYSPVATIVPSPDADERALRHMVLAAARCSTGRAVETGGQWASQGDPMEAAIDACAARFGLDMATERASSPERRRFPFDPVRRRMAVVVGDEAYVKGAPDAVLPRAGDALDAHAALERLSQLGYRVLAVARRPVGELPSAADGAERDLELLGLLALEDPPREDVHDAIRACRRAGVRIAMVTGDHPGTAHAIATQVGLDRPDAPRVLGAELPEDPAELAAIVGHDGTIISRVDPETKLRIAEALRSVGHVVAMTGDGVNDGPALHAAHIGIAMGASGTDVAREAADLVLLDDHFRSIVAAIEQGRAIDANIRRFLTYHLTDNVAELTPFVVWALTAGNVPLAIGVMQVLALDLATDTLSAVALGAERPAPDVLDGPPAHGRLLDRRVATRAFGILGPTEATWAMTAFLTTLLLGGWRFGSEVDDGLLASASGAAFSAVVIGQAANAFACRSDAQPPWRLGWATNRLLVWAKGAELVLAATFVAVPILAATFGHAVPTLVGFLVAASTAPAVLLLDALWKRRHAHA